MLRYICITERLPLTRRRVVSFAVVRKGKAARAQVVATGHQLHAGGGFYGLRSLKVRETRQWQIQKSRRGLSVCTSKIGETSVHQASPRVDKRRTQPAKTNRGNGALNLSRKTGVLCDGRASVCKYIHMVRQGQRCIDCDAKNTTKKNTPSSRSRPSTQTTYM